MEDTEIIELYFSRVETAIGETSKKYGSYLNQVAYNILRIREDTEEVVQDTYLAAWNTIPPQRPNVFRHYLSRITRNLAFDRLDYLTAKCRNPHMTVVLSELEDCLPDWKGDPYEAVELRAVGQSINAFLSGLDRTDCGIFLCRYYHSLSVSEISKKTGLSENNVKYRLRRMRKSLRLHLEKEGMTI